MAWAAQRRGGRRQHGGVGWPGVRAARQRYMVAWAGVGRRGITHGRRRGGVAAKGLGDDATAVANLAVAAVADR